MNLNQAYNKYKTELCNNDMTFQECELAILRNAVDNNELRKMGKIAQSPEVSKIMDIVEKFIKDKGLICYGGTAINNILPKEDQFYDRSVEIPDYDFFSTNALDDAIELANIYYLDGYNEVEAKAGVHKGTYKVFVNFIPVADITYLHPVLFENIEKDAINKHGILYAPPNYLRMSMFLELSRPDGDVSRWEKVLKRINLLNKHYPIHKNKEYCETVDFQRGINNNMKTAEKMYYLVRDFLIDEECIFFGGYATSLYSKYMKKPHNRNVYKIPDFDVLANDAKTVAKKTKQMLLDNGYKNIKIIHHSAVGEVIPYHYEVTISGNSVAYIYVPISCHAYNTVLINEKEIKIATIDTMLSFYLAFNYADKPYYNKERILCMSAYLFEVEQRNRLEQKGLLKRFSDKCYGKQETLEDMRAEKTKMHSKLKRNTREYDEWFLKYNPETNPKLKRTRQSIETDSKSPSLRPDITYEVVTPKTTTKQRKTRKQKPTVTVEPEDEVEPETEPEETENVESEYIPPDKLKKKRIKPKTRKRWGFLF
jgi:hypothetical protein